MHNKTREEKYRTLPKKERKKEFQAVIVADDGDYGGDTHTLHKNEVNTEYRGFGRFLFFMIGQIHTMAVTVAATRIYTKYKTPRARARYTNLCQIIVTILLLLLFGCKTAY